MENDKSKKNVVVTHKKTKSGAKVIHVEIPDDTKSTCTDKEPTICARCKWSKFEEEYTLCKVPCEAKLCFVSGCYDHPTCRAFNKDGNCKYYEEKQSLWKRFLLAWMSKGLKG